MGCLICIVVAVVALGFAARCDHEEQVAQGKAARIGKVVVVTDKGYGTWVKDMKNDRIGFHRDDFGQRGDTLAIDLNNVEWK